MEQTPYFVDVLLPLHLPDTYTYRVPFEYNESICVGQRVVVQFGQKRLYSALIRRIHTNMPAYKTKYILGILDVTSTGEPAPIVTEQQFLFWEWMAQYYMCYPGDVMANAFPTAFKLASESYIAIHPEFDGSYDDLSANEMKVLEALMNRTTDNKAGVLSIDEVQEITGFQKIMPLIKTMIEKHIIMMDEELKQRFKPKSTTFLTLNPRYLDQQEMRNLFDELERKATTRKQLSVLMKFMQLSHFGKESIKKKEITEIKELSDSALCTLIKNEVILQENKVESRLKEFDAETDVDTIVLSEQQQDAFEYLQQGIVRPQEGASPIDFPRTALLHGVTSSGKTEVYIKLIDKTLRQGKQVLFLLPEIALTAQIINRLRKYFGNRVGVYHSRFSANERAEVWKKTLDPGPDGYSLLLGARSALFLPFHNLGLVIVDEEHDPSYKQIEPQPHYHGRDAAIYLAHLWKAYTVLGSATPSLESYFNAKQGKYGIAVMDKRYGGLQMPEVLCADMKDAHRKKEVQAEHFSKLLTDSVKEALENNEQVILFQNRRGFSLRLECDACHTIPQCVNCDVSLVYHKSSNSLRCHYCGYSIPVPTECPACHSTAMKMKGFGTERIEDDLSIIFPKAKIARMDLDSTSQKQRYIEILNDFEDHNIDILVGTQMVTKGLDFDNVSVVGILSADNLISFPDFRAYERAFQQMTQVSGRAGRHGHRGKVIIQSFNPWHQAIRDSMENNYLSMYGSQIQERRVFRYPPFYKLIDITIKHKDADTLNLAAANFAAMLRSNLGERVMGPEYPSVSRIRGQYIKKIMVRFERNEPVSKGKEIILQHANAILNDKAYGRITITFDVDPA
ncbi:MAG: primosomal protein N' [Bacteroidales bacterium]|nr:primosomal protein N' [Bacteroidales bacterium]